MFARFRTALPSNAAGAADPSRSLGDLLVWAHLIDDDVLLNKDGSLLAAWSYRGPDLDSSSAAELAQLSDHLNRALVPLGNDWMLHVDAIRRPATEYPDAGAFPDPVTRLIDAERRVHYESAANFETTYYLAITWCPPTTRKRNALARFLSTSTAPEDRADLVLSYFAERLQDFRGLLVDRFALRRLSGSALLTYLHAAVTGLHHSIAVPPVPVDLDALLFTAPLYGGLTPRIGANHLRIVAVAGLPFATQPALLDHLNRLPFAFRWSSRFIFIDQLTAQRIIKRLRGNWMQGREDLASLAAKPREGVGPAGGGRVFTDRHAENMAEAADEALELATNGTVRYGWYTPVIVLTDPDEARVNSNAEKIEKEVRSLGFSASIVETFNALAAYLGSLPGHGRYNVRRPLIHSLNLADLLPITSIWTGSPRATLPALEGAPALVYARTNANTPYYLNLHVGDVGHTLVIGPTGSGKSTLLALIQAQWRRYPDSQLIVFDKGYSAMPLALAGGGTHYDLAGEDGGDIGFNPLAYIHDAGDRAWVTDWLELLLNLNGPPLTSTQRQLLTVALNSLAAQIPEDANAIPTLDELAIYVQSHDIRMRLDPYTRENGSYFGLLSSHHDHFGGGPWHVFEMGNLLELGEKIVIPVLTYLFYRIRRRLRGVPTLIILDEAWAYLQNPLFGQRIQQWLKELRKFNASIVFATQSLADVANSPYRDLLLESAPTKLFLANPEATTPQGSAFYHAVGLSPRQIELVGRAIPKREYYVTSPDGSRLVDLSLGPFTLAWTGVSARDQQHHLRNLLRRGGPEPWQVSWLRHRGLYTWATELAHHFEAPDP